MSDAFTDAYRTDYRPSWHFTKREQKRHGSLIKQIRVVEAKMAGVQRAVVRTEKQAIKRAIREYRLGLAMDKINTELYRLCKDKWY